MYSHHVLSSIIELKLNNNKKLTTIKYKLITKQSY